MLAEGLSLLTIPQPPSAWEYPRWCRLEPRPLFPWEGRREGGRSLCRPAAGAGMVLSVPECHLLALPALAVSTRGDAPVRRDAQRVVSTSEGELAGRCKPLYPRAGTELS